MLISHVVSVSSHSISIVSALLGSSSCVEILLGAIRVLIITNATPVVVHRFSRSKDVSMFIFFL